MRTVVLLVLSYAFMVYAWYGHLKPMSDKPLPMVILISWGIAFFEYCFQVPANRIGAASFDLVQLKVIQEVVHLIVFAIFAATVMRTRLTTNHAAAALCLALAVWFAFRDSAAAGT